MAITLPDSTYRCSQATTLPDSAYRYSQATNLPDSAYRYSQATTLPDSTYRYSQATTLPDSAYRCIRYNNPTRLSLQVHPLQQPYQTQPTCAAMATTLPDSAYRYSQLTTLPDSAYRYSQATTLPDSAYGYRRCNRDCRSPLRPVQSRQSLVDQVESSTEAQIHHLQRWTKVKNDLKTHFVEQIDTVVLT